MSLGNKIVLSSDRDVRHLARRIGRDVGNLDELKTAIKKSLVGAINELKDHNDNADKRFATKTDISKLASKVDLTQAIADLIDGAGEDEDTLKELAEKITALAQADQGLVSAAADQEFNENQKRQARDNIDAVSVEQFNSIVADSDYVAIYESVNQ